MNSQKKGSLGHWRERLKRIKLPEFTLKFPWVLQPSEDSIYVKQQMFIESLLRTIAKAPAGSHQRPSADPCRQESAASQGQSEMDPEPGDSGHEKCSQIQSQTRLQEAVSSLLPGASTLHHAILSWTSVKWRVTHLNVHAPTLDQPKSLVFSSKKKEVPILCKVSLLDLTKDGPDSRNVVTGRVSSLLKKQKK